MNQEIKNEINVSKLDEKIICNNTEKQKGQAEKLVHGKTREEWIELVGNVPAFLDDDGPSDRLPPFVCTTNIIELFGWQPGESLDEVISRKNRENK